MKLKDLKSGMTIKFIDYNYTGSIETAINNSGTNIATYLGVKISRIGTKCHTFLFADRWEGLWHYDSNKDNIDVNYFSSYFIILGASEKVVIEGEEYI